MKLYDKKVTECKLEDGRIVVCDGASYKEASDFYTPDKWDFIGKGVIYRIGGILQSGTELCWFYVRKVAP